MAPSLLPVIFIVAILVTSSFGCRLSEEEQCLTKRLTAWCATNHLQVTISGASSSLPCNQLLTDGQVESLRTAPTLVVTNTNSFQLPMKILVVMFDVDAPVDPQNMADGWMHWVASGTMLEDGVVSVHMAVTGKEFTGPNPPRGMEHRYQLMIFQYDGEFEDIVVSPTRIDQLCNFMESNSLAPPISATQIRFER